MTPTVSPIDLLRERKFLRGLIQQNPLRPVVLVGSWARGSQLPSFSDIDVLVIDETAVDSAPPAIQVISLPQAVFRERAFAGDDFTQWALRYGVPLGGRKAWEALRRELLQIVPWPDPRRSRERAAKALDAATALRRMGDLAGSTAETLVALSHLARADLLSHGVFPLSRPELHDQLLAIGNADLAAALRRSIEVENELIEAELREIHEMLVRRLQEPEPSPVDADRASGSR